MISNMVSTAAKGNANAFLPDKENKTCPSGSVNLQAHSTSYKDSVTLTYSLTT